MKTRSGSGLGKREDGVGKVAVLSPDLSNPNFSLPFFQYVTTPKNTDADNPLITSLNLPIGQIVRVWTEFPRGCSGLVGVQLWRGPYQIFPLPSGVWLKSDNAVMNFGFSHDMTVEPYQVEIRTYNLDDTYQHTIWIGIEMTGPPTAETLAMQKFFKTLVKE